MIQIVVGIVLILLHIICCILVWVGICTHIINVKKYLMFPVVFVPVWGVLCVLILHFQIWIQSDQRKEVGVEKMKVNEEIYKNISGLRRYPAIDNAAEEILQMGSYKTIAKTRYVNDKQITDHYAIIPTGQGMNALNGLSLTSQLSLIHI